MKKSSGLDFTSSPRKRSPVVTVAFIALAVLIIGAVSFIILLAANDFDTAKFFGTRRPEETSSAAESVVPDVTEPSVASPEFSDREAINFLFVCHDASELSFCSVVSVSVKENNIKIKAVSPEMSVENNGEKTTVGDAFRQKGVSGIKNILSEKGIRISKYVSASETNFKLVIGKLGSTQLDLPHNVDFSDGGVRYTFSAGKNTFTADLLLKLIKFGDNGEERTSLQALAQAAVIRRNLTADNFNKGTSFFSTLINPVETDITAFDYSAASSAIKSFIAASPSIVPIG